MHNDKESQVMLLGNVRSMGLLSQLKRERDIRIMRGREIEI